VCGHAFCEGCLLKAVLMQLSQGSPDVSCPLCRHHLHVDDVTADQALLTRIRLILSERRRVGRVSPCSEHGSRITAGTARREEAQQRPMTSSGALSARQSRHTPRQQCDEGRLSPTLSRTSPVPWGMPATRPATVGGGCSRVTTPWQYPAESTGVGDFGMNSDGVDGSWLVVTSRCRTRDARPNTSGNSREGSGTHRQRDSRRPMPPPRPASQLRGLFPAESKGSGHAQELSVDVRAAQLRIRPSSVSGTAGASRSWWCSSAGRDETFSTFGSLALASALGGPLATDEPDKKPCASESTAEALPQVPAHVGSEPRPKPRVRPQRGVLAAWH